MRDLDAFYAVIAARQGLAFSWVKGRCCASHMAAAVEAQTGVDVLEGLTWRTRREAVAVINSLGGLEAAMDARFDRIAPAMAKRGDIAGIADRLLGVQLAVVDGAVLTAPGDYGLEHVGREAMIIAWDAETARVPTGPAASANALAQANRR